MTIWRQIKTFFRLLFRSETSGPGRVPDTPEMEIEKERQRGRGMQGPGPGG